MSGLHDHASSSAKRLRLPSASDVLGDRQGGDNAINNADGAVRVLVREVGSSDQPVQP
jgi:hypothetical protein